jgi:predicted ArsR family transcriptional regulator
MKMDEVKDFATKLLSRDTWCIEGAEWGKASNKKRVASLNKILTEVLIAEGYKPDTRKYNPAEREVKLHKCSCGKIAKRYISSLDRTVKWENKCLNCEPHTKGRK